MKSNEVFLNTKQVAKRLGYKHPFSAIQLIEKSILPNAFKHKGEWRIPLTDIKSLENTQANTLDTTQAAKRLGKSSNVLIGEMLREGKFPNAFKNELSMWRIPLNDIENFEAKNNVEHHVNVKDAAIILGYKFTSSILNLLSKEMFPKAFKSKKRWWIHKNDLQILKKKMEKKTSSNYKIKRNKTKSKNQDRLLPLKDDPKLNGFISTSVIQKKLNLSRNQIINLIKKDAFMETMRYRGRWWVTNESLEKYLREVEKTDVKKREKVIPLKDDPKLNGFIGIPIIQKKLNLSSNQIVNLVKKGVFMEYKRYRGRWWITNESFKKYLSEIENTDIKKQNTLSSSDTASRLGYADSASISGLIKKEKQFPNAFKIKNQWRIPEEDIKAFENKRMKANKKINFTSKVAYEELLEYINTIEVSKYFLETRKLFIQYSLLQINNMDGSNKYRRDRVLLYKRFYNRMVQEFSNEIFLVSMTEIEEMLHETSSFKKGEKRVLIPFLRYVYNQKEMDPDLEFSLLSTNERTNEQDIYSPELFHEIYQYVKMIQEHVPHAIENRYYANMWVYTILLLTDFIRGQDLIINTPSIDLEAVDISSFDFFINNKLSNHQTQSIINQLYSHFRNKRTSKTNELLTFLVAPDLVEPLGYALAISELHRNVETNELLLNTFLEGVYNRVRTQGKIRHKRFFQRLNTTSEFQFSSLKMNRTVATYLFYSITEEDGQDSDLALHLSQVSRSHKKADSTSRYIQSTNKDGSINRVSYNLFKRGHFGWLYNYLLLYVSQFENTQDTLEERSNLIEKTREEIAPHDLENMAEFVHNSLIPINLKGKSNNMESFIQNIYGKKQSVISKLKNYSKQEIRDIITNLAKGNLPSKNEGAQCLVYPDCKNPMLSNCFSCEYVIPGNLMLIQLNEELKRLINNLKHLTDEIIMIRESMLLMHALLIWKEARIAFGEDKVNAYIPIKETWQEIESIAGKLSIN